MTIEEQKLLAQRKYPIQYQQVIEDEYPEAYILVSCEWLAKGFSHNAVGWCIREWSQYVGDKYDIYKIIDINDFVHTILEFKLYGKRDTTKRWSFHLQI